MKFAAILISASILSGASAAAQEPIVGRATVIDGDTIEINGTRIRFGGIDAPESWQFCMSAAGEKYLCGQKAAFALDEFLAAARPTMCEKTDMDRYGRVVANCFRNDGTDVSKWMVENGYAVDWPKYSHGVYAGYQDAAKAASVGIWQGNFELPCAARAARLHRNSSC
jgi:endonuclease YncB( thermonuclease family)